MSEPLETRWDHNALGHPVPSLIANTCDATFISGYATALRCSLFAGHAGDHESYGGSSWAL